MDREAWWATVPRVVKSRTRLSNLTHTYMGGGDNMFRSFKVLLLRQHLSRSTSSREAIVLLLMLMLSHFSRVRLCATP